MSSNTLEACDALGMRVSLLNNNSCCNGCGKQTSRTSAHHTGLRQRRTRYRALAYAFAEKQGM